MPNSMGPRNRRFPACHRLLATFPRCRCPPSDSTSRRSALPRTTSSIPRIITSRTSLAMGTIHRCGSMLGRRLPAPLPGSPPRTTGTCRWIPSRPLSPPGLHRTRPPQSTRRLPATPSSRRRRRRQLPGRERRRRPPLRQTTRARGRSERRAATGRGQTARTRSRSPPRRRSRVSNSEEASSPRTSRPAPPRPTPPACPPPPRPSPPCRPPPPPSRL
ncbi:hypothetical protein T484DRAFT_1949332 [Baffinella frigidus]|nr:hypothetical protein T484DRAFT_1949332 [Cryptophyta sp. CCMP2293]